MISFSKSLRAAILGALAVGLLATVTAPASAETFQIDAVHSAVLFRVGHFNTSKVWGRFNDISGTVVFDPASPAAGSVKLEIKTESVDTHSENRDRHLKSPDFFNAVEFPVISFESTKIEVASEHKYNVTGVLNLHGVKKTITLPVEHTGSGKHPRSGKEIVGFEARLTVKRSDFGMNFMVGPVTDEVDLIIAVEAGVN